MSGPFVVGKYYLIAVDLTTIYAVSSVVFMGLVLPFLFGG
jgi:hypothetical protein